MAITAKSKLASTWFTPNSEKNSSNPTKFKIRYLTGREFLEVKDHLIFDEENDRVLIGGKGLFLAVRFCLEDWENYLDEDGKPIKFSKDEIENIPENILFELAMAIINKKSALTEEEKKIL